MKHLITHVDFRHALMSVIPPGKAEVIRAWWRLDKSDIAAAEARFGQGVLGSDTFQEHYGFRDDDRKRLWEIEVDELKCLENLIGKHALDATEGNVLHGVSSGQGADKALSSLAQRTPKQEALLQEIKRSRESRFTLGVIDVLSERQPRFFFTSHFERMSGMVSLQKLQQDRRTNGVGGDGYSCLFWNMPARR